MRFFKTLLSSTVLAALTGTVCEAATPAISPAFSSKCQVEMKAKSTTEKRKWTIFVEQVRTDRGQIEPKALLGSFTFGRAEDPFEYPPQTTSVSPIVDSTNYKIAVYFYNTDDQTLQPHSDKYNLANSFEINTVGKITKMQATFWDNENDHNAQIHRIALIITCD